MRALISRDHAAEAAEGRGRLSGCCSAPASGTGYRLPPPESPLAGHGPRRGAGPCPPRTQRGLPSRPRRRFQPHRCPLTLSPDPLPSPLTSQPRSSTPHRNPRVKRQEVGTAPGHAAARRARQPLPPGATAAGGVSLPGTQERPRAPRGDLPPPSRGHEAASAQRPPRAGPAGGLALGRGPQATTIAQAAVAPATAPLLCPRFTLRQTPPRRWGGGVRAPGDGGRSGYRCPVAALPLDVPARHRGAEPRHPDAVVLLGELVVATETREG